MPRRLLFFMFATLFCLLMLLPQLFAEAATHVVTVSADTGPGSLREAIQLAASGDTITIDATLTGSTLVLTSELPPITKTLTIDGRPAPNFTISGANLYSSGFAIQPTGNLTVIGLTFTNGALPAGDGGGAFWVEGKLQLQDSTLRNNRASYGGAIFNDGGHLIIVNSTLTNNQATDASNLGGGGAIDQFLNGSAEIRYSTITQNSAANVTREGLWIESGTITITASILDHVNGSCAIDGGSGTLVSGGYNVEHHVNGAANPCGFVSIGDEVTQDPKLSPLADNGGAAWTQAVDSDGAGVDRVPRGEADCGSSMFVDQRGSPRLGACDSGAYEFLPYAPEISFAASQVSEIESAEAITLSIVLDAPTALPITLNYTVSDGTALAGTDFDATTTPMQIAAGASIGTLSIPLLNDAIEELPESFTVTLSNPSWGELTSTSEVTVTIIDDDAPQSNQHTVYLPAIIR